MDDLIGVSGSDEPKSEEPEKKHVSFNDQITEIEVEPVPLIIGK